MFTTQEVVTVEVGRVIVLKDKDQIRRRKRHLVDLGDGRFEVVLPVQFKIGEKLLVEGDLDKRTMFALGMPVEEDKPKPKASKAKKEVDAE